MREIAMIGMGCRFPDSPDLGGYWRTVREGRVCFRDVPPDRWDRELFHSADRRESDETYGRKMDPDDVALALLRGMAAGRYHVVPGRDGKLPYYASRWFPGLVRWVIDREVRSCAIEEITEVLR